MEGKTILIIDTDTTSRNFLANTLQQHQYNVLQASFGKEGLVYAWRDRPDLILVDPVLPDLKDKELIQKLRQDRRTSKIPIIAFSGDTKPERVAECLKMGFNEYLIKSAQTIPILLDILSNMLKGRTAVMKKGGLLIVFLSAKGGIGTSSLCVNIAMNIARKYLEAKVAVVDMVLPIGSIAQIVGYNGNINLTSVAEMPPEQMTTQYLHEQLPTLPLWQFQLLAGSPDPEAANQLIAGRIPEIIDALKAAYDYVLIDLGRSLSKISLPIIEESDLITLIFSTDLSTVTLTKTIWVYLKSKNVGAERVYTILNRALGLEGLTKTEAEQILDLEIKTTIPHMAGNFTLANNQHQPIGQKYPNDTAALILKEAASQMADLARMLRGK